MRTRTSCESDVTSTVFGEIVTDLILGGSVSMRPEFKTLIVGDSMWLGKAIPWVPPWTISSSFSSLRWKLSVQFPASLNGGMRIVCLIGSSQVIARGSIEVLEVHR